jgi:predicted bacteriocin transport accessory protein
LSKEEELSMATTKKAASTKKVVNKKEEIVAKEEKCECGCNDCKCGSTECLLKSIFYTLICILVFAAVSAVFTIILAVDYHNNGKNRNYSTSTSTETGTNTNTGTEDAEYDVSMFTEITAEQLINLYNGEEKSLIYIGRPTCGYCVAFLPTLQQAQTAFGYQTYYYDISNVTDADYDAITGLNEFMAENFGYTPMVIVVQGGQILSASGDGQGWVGYSDYDTFAAYLQGLGY